MIKDLKNIHIIWNKLMYVLSKQQKEYGILVFVMSLFGALLETMGVSVIIPMVQAMVTPEVLLQNKYASYFIKLFHLSFDKNIIWVMCIFVVIVYFLKNLYLTLLSWVRAKYSCKIMRELSVKVMQSYMKREYPFFLKTNIGNLIRGTSGDANGVYSIVYQGFRIISEGLTIFCICVYIFLTDSILASSIVVIGVLCLLLIFVIFRRFMKKISQKNWKYAALTSKYMMEAYNGIKEVLVMGKQKFFAEKYEQAYAEQQKAAAGNIVASESPSYIIEAVCITGIIISVAYRVSSMTDPTEFIPQLAAFAIAAFRILPSLGKISNAFNTLVYHIPYLNDAYDDFIEVNLSDKQSREKNQMSSVQECSGIRATFNKELDIKKVTWKYDSIEKAVLKDMSLSIAKGRSIGIIGESGAGKSTLMDIILGLLRPQEGCIEVDGININLIPEQWAQMIGYVPQSVYLTDDSIRNNVAFGLDECEIVNEQIEKVLREAQIYDFVMQLPNGINTIVGERGVRFSGGQRQRLAIARALYHEPDILVFDEATSALDNDTEAAVMESIDALHGKKTLIIVAHRLSTIKNCDEVYEVKGGQVIRKEKDEY